MRTLLAAALAASTLMACSALLDVQTPQCRVNDDCLRFDPYAICFGEVCEPGPEPGDSGTEEHHD